MADRHVACFPAVCQGKFLGQLLGDVAVCGLQVPGRGNCIQISFHQFPVVLDEGEEDVGELFLEEGNDTCCPFHILRALALPSQSKRATRKPHAHVCNTPLPPSKPTGA